MLHPRKLKKLRSDNGGEYKSKEFDDFCSRYGIAREYTRGAHNIMAILLVSK
jgi:transposase InsO family protein